MKTKRFPLKGTFELTGRCNMQCNMCYIRVNEQTIISSGKRERTAAEWIHLAEQAVDAGTLTLLLTGGEITIRPDFCEIYEAIAKMGFITTLYTNATNISDKIMALFEKYPPHIIGVTMYGASPETYKTICGHADGYDRFVSGLRKLKTLPSILETRTTLVKKNIDDYLAMKSFIQQEFDEKKVLHVSARIYNSIRGGCGHPLEERLDAASHCSFFYEWLHNLNKLLEDGTLTFADFSDAPKLIELEQNLKRRSIGSDGGYLFQNCGAGIDEYFISWNGDMYACGMLPTGCTHPFEQGFQNAWEQLPNQYPKTIINETCKNCDLQPYCESCPAYRMAETGSWNGIPSFACQSAECLKDMLEPIFHKAKKQFEFK